MKKYPHSLTSLSLSAIYQCTCPDKMFALRENKLFLSIFHIFKKILHGTQHETIGMYPCKSFVCA